MTPLRRRAIRDGLWLAGVLCAGYLFLVLGPALGGPGFDAYSYWAVDLDDAYRGEIGGQGWFPYSPAAAQVASLFKILPWPVFVWLWVGLLFAVLVALTGRWAVPLLALPPISNELFTGNVNVLIAAAIYLGFRYPAAWAFVLLTKAAPGVGLIWFAVRREWRSLAVALGVTAVLAGLSYLTVPRLWHEWLGIAVLNAGRNPELSHHLPIPLILRLPVAVALVAWGAHTGRRWTVPVGAIVAMPVLWFNVLSILVALIPILRADARSRRDLRRLAKGSPESARVLAQRRALPEEAA